ncbi:MAG: hypothetical protein KJN92_16580, partial [Gemmatimonadetes bacterium]|nr:hypothetical protein [Gemmatimonadota bacterium]
TQPTSEAQEGQDRPTWKNRVLTGLGAGLLGAGIGYFASQVSDSDWDEVNGNYTTDRSPWALLGGSVGFAVGFSFPLGSLPESQRTLPPRRRREVITSQEIEEALSEPIGQARENITAAEMRRAVVTNAKELVDLLRPAWLIRRGGGSFGDPDSEDIRVYLDNQDFGGIESLELIQVVLIESIQYFDAGRATTRFGAGHTQGVIQVISK